MEDNCFTILCWFLPYINMNQSQIYIYPLPFEPPSHLPPHPTPLGCHRALGLRSLHHRANSHRLSNFPYGNVYVSMLPSQFAPPSPSPAASTSLFSVSASPLLPCRKVHRYHLSRFHICALIYDICLSLSELTSLCIIGSTLVELSQMFSF